MFAILGITGQVGGATARALLAHGHQVRAIVRNPEKAASWQAEGVELVVADVDDPTALTAALGGVEGAFVMLPSNFAPSPDFSEARRTIASLVTALSAARPPRVVALSSIGSEQEHGLGLITSTHLLEKALLPLGLNLVVLRAAWFMENFVHDLQSVRYSSELDSYLQPADKPFAMIATDDIGITAAHLLTEPSTSISTPRRLELAGPRDYTPTDVAAAFAAALSQTVNLKLIPRDAWVGQFIAQGMPEDRTAPRVDMFDGINSGHIHFGVPGTEPVRGTTELEIVLRQLVART